MTSMFTMYYKFCTFVGRWENNGSAEFLCILPLCDYSIMKEQTNPIFCESLFFLQKCPLKDGTGNYNKDSQRLGVQYLEDVSRWNKLRKDINKPL